MPNAKTEGEEITCVLKPNCSENPGMPVGECYAPGTGSLAQQDDADRATSSEEGEAQPSLPACTGAKGETKGVDCVKKGGLKGCKGNVLPTVGDGEEANCRVLPLCSEAGTGDCYAGAPSLV